MMSVSRPQKATFAVLLGAVLCLAQSLAVAHAYQHDLGSAVDAPCASCVIGGQLAAGCDDNGGDAAPRPGITAQHSREQLPLRTLIIPAAKQRGPPA